MRIALIWTTLSAAAACCAAQQQHLPLFIRKMGQPLIIIRSAELHTRTHPSKRKCSMCNIMHIMYTAYIYATEQRSQTRALDVHCPHTHTTHECAVAPVKSHACDCGSPIQVSLYTLFFRTAHICHEPISRTAARHAVCCLLCRRRISYPCCANKRRMHVYAFACGRSA